MSKITKSDIENIRKAMGTLPSQSPEKSYTIKNDISSIYVKMTDCPKNPYKIIARAVTATWGDNESGSTQKWEKLSPKNRYRVVLSNLTGNTLPQAAEGVQFQFEVNGLARHDFDQHARARIGAHFMSIGTRDNNKLDADILLYDDIMQRMEKEPEYKKKVEEWVKLSKDIYEESISYSESSWQTGRAFLPQSVAHSYVFGMNYLALKGQMARRLMACEQEGIVALHWLIRKEIDDKFPLLANYLVPVCDKVRRCVYMEGPEGMTKYFSNLFDGCGRWEVKNKENQVYKEFNRSCTDYSRLKELGIPVLDPHEFKRFSSEDFDKLDGSDRKLFEQD
jgi:thymidylate synthase ThyX